MIDLFSIAVETDGVFEVDPDKLYPAALAHVQSVLDKPRPNGPLGALYDEAKQLPAQAWQWALKTAEECPAKYLDPRATALEIARLWFTELLHVSIGGGNLHIHILAKDGHWRLAPKKDLVSVRLLGFTIRKE